MSRCIYCDGYVICEDDPKCMEMMGHRELIEGGWTHSGCFCVGLTAEGPALAECGPKCQLKLSVYVRPKKADKTGEESYEIRITPVECCP